MYHHKQLAPYLSDTVFSNEGFKTLTAYWSIIFEILRHVYEVECKMNSEKKGAQMKVTLV